MNATLVPAADLSDFEDLLAAHRGIVLKIAASYAREREDRADLAQEIALQLWRAWPGYDATRPFSTWMYRVALNVAITHRRRAHAAPVHEALDAELDTLAGARDVDHEAREQLALVERAMAALGPLDRALLLLHLEGLPHAQCGEVLGLTENNVAVRLSRIRQHLRRHAGGAHEGATR